MGKKGGGRWEEGGGKKEGQDIHHMSLQLYPRSPQTYPLPARKTRHDTALALALALSVLLSLCCGNSYITLRTPGTTPGTCCNTLRPTAHPGPPSPPTQVPGVVLYLFASAHRSPYSTTREDSGVLVASVAGFVVVGGKVLVGGRCWCKLLAGTVFPPSVFAPPPACLVTVR